MSFRVTAETVTAEAEEPNDFALGDSGKQRFVRSLIVLGNMIPSLADVAPDHRGLFAHVRDEPVDWTLTSRTVAFEGTQRDGMTKVAKSVIGYRDRAANALLFGIYQDELLQMSLMIRAFCTTRSPLL